MRLLQTVQNVLLASVWVERWPLRPLVTALRRRRRAFKATEARVLREAAVREHGTVTRADLLHHLRSAGIRVGDVVFFQGSLNDMPTFGGGARELVALLRELVGESGTLLMPAYTTPPARGAWEFDAIRTPTYTGLANELFRRSAGVRRSLHPRHSVCAFGPLAQALTQGHERCARADGADSPFDRIRLRADAKFLTLGLPPGYLSFLHWVEDIDPERFPWPLYERRPRRIAVRCDDDRQIVVEDWWRRTWTSARLDYGRVAARLSPAAMSFGHWRGIAYGVYPAAALALELLQLRDQGVVHYS